MADNYRLYRVRVITPDGRRVVYRVMAKSSGEAARQKRGKGRVVSAVKA